MAGRFEGRVAIVTGGSGGMGRAASLAFAREGARVVIADVLVEEGRQTEEMVKEAGGEALFLTTDVSRAGEVKAMVAAAVNTYGRLDIAFNNAGIEGILVPTVEYPEEVWDRVIDVNLKGVWLCMKYEIPEMIKQGGGAIVNTSSIAGLRGSNRWSAYNASKHGVIGLTKTVAREYGGQGIRANAVCPSTIVTPMYDRVLAQDRESLIAAHPVGRLGTPEDVAETVMWLCSDEASFISGQALGVDGAYLA
ncbi:MAG: SDR family oxidoreductase [Chloroflexi bacterium]|nr:SDR family oxidoreductase [Chloroflexota bacterium]